MTVYQKHLMEIGKNKQNNEPKYRSPLTLTNNRTLPKVKEVVRKHWNMSQINKEFKNVFPEPSITCVLP